ncbi:DUF3990 domain-containing protein [Tannockella kyphosi]|uniref:DUF3990 domain-containing protein n=1 Tax=Tannockella kyphosi TaxID=2899121 RepID=UPI00201324E1|nr:DUF3990 domain-containing protein [Tannockella kyphosi]
MEYKFAEDLRAVRELLGLTQAELAELINVEQVTISRSEIQKTKPSAQFMEKLYEFAFNKGIQLNRLKEMFWQEKKEKNHQLLFHGSKNIVNGELSICVGRSNNDFGSGFYTGETYEQAVSFVSGYDNSSVYFLDFNRNGLKAKEYIVDQEWMMAIAYYRGALEEYKDHKIVREIIKHARECDYIIAPIADNRMFQIIDSFVQGEITVEQCQHSLAATNLGKQYVFISEKAISQVRMLERVYMCQSEREYYNKIRRAETKLGLDKVKLAKISYRGKGMYIDEMFK